jgi:hypothetical protein
MIWQMVVRGCILPSALGVLFMDAIVAARDVV